MKRFRGISALFQQQNALNCETFSTVDSSAKMPFNFLFQISFLATLIFQFQIVSCKRYWNDFVALLFIFIYFLLMNVQLKRSHLIFSLHNLFFCFLFLERKSRKTIWNDFVASQQQNVLKCARICETFSTVDSSANFF